MTAEETAYSILRNDGWSHEQACGIMGNIRQESDWHTQILGFDKTGSYGLCQWLGPRKQALFQFAGHRALPVHAVATQIEFLCQELRGTEKAAGLRLRNCNTVKSSALAFSRWFERPAARYAHNDKRIAYAENYHHQFRSK